MPDNEQVILKISETENILKSSKPDGTPILSHQYFDSGKWKACCYPITLTSLSEEKAIERIKTCKSYGKR